ncbi:AraC family transcriptional regulator [uncultured Sphingomonas sp.]|uniref:helix-turn-helix domain-containing protein n=1 Tax=uncultured Sphingomonas sp. TaxID=158754 RepID=UPI0025D3CCB4|nr:AraC family transcriptional regulator [uncultured Sphingomonas sp.]
MYHQALIDVAAPAQTGGPPELTALLARAIRSHDEDPPLAGHRLERLSSLGVTHGADGPEDLLPEGLVHVGGAAKGGLAGWQLRRVAAHVDSCLQGPILTSTLAEVAQLSTGHFCRAFKISTGETPHAYIVRQRIRRAQLLMRDTRDTLSQIACSCGLSDQAHLTRLFRRLVGTTPLVWRRAWQQRG